MAGEKIGSIYYDLDLDDKKFKQGIGGATKLNKTFTQRLQDSSVQLAIMGAAATIAFAKVKSGIDSALKATVQQQSALMGLSSIAKAFKQDANKAQAAAMGLAEDGLMPLSDAATGLKNLLAAGFNLDQAIVLMNRFKDSAAFGKQGALSFGQAIVGATEGIKNGNSILVDNAGVTKNLSMMLEEAGYSAQDLMKASSDAGVRQAIFNGILKETNPMLGDAAKLSNSLGGAMARQETAAFKLKVAFGEALQPSMTGFIETSTKALEAITEFTKAHPDLIDTLIRITTGTLSIASFVGILGSMIGFLSGLSLPMIVLGVAILGVVSAVTLLQKHWDKVVTLYNARLKPAVDKLKESIQKLAEELKPLVDKTLKDLEGMLNRIVPMMIDLAIAVGTWLVQAFQDARDFINEFVQIFNKLFTEAAPGLKSAWASLINQINNELMPALRELWTTIKEELLPALSDLWQMAKDQLLPALKLLWEAAAPLLVPALKILATIIGVLLIGAIYATIAGLKIFVGMITQSAKGLNTLISHFSSTINNIVMFSSIVKARSEVVIKTVNDMVVNIARSLAKIYTAIRTPFESAFNWVITNSAKVKNALDRINPFHRESPSLIDWVERGTDRITGLYDNMFNQIDSISSQGRMAMMGASTSIASPSANAQGGATLAPAPITIVLNPSGLVARSRGELRDISMDMVEVINENLRSIGKREIGK